MVSFAKSPLFSNSNYSDVNWRLEMTIETNLENCNWTPLHTRILAHRIGDGTVNVHGHYVWDNKNPSQFLLLAKQLGIKVWGPVVCKKWGTSKIMISKKFFQHFGNIVEADGKNLSRNSAVLIRSIEKLPFPHKLQTFCALIVDDGCCKNWMLTLFEDQNKETVDAVYHLWNSIFPATAKISFIVTKKGTTVYHIYINKLGIIQLKEAIDKAMLEFGMLAGLWWKQDALNKRYKKATNERASILEDTKNENEFRKAQILNFVRAKEKVSFSEIQNNLHLSTDRTRLLLNKLIKQNFMFVSKASCRSLYSITKIDVSEGYRKRLVLDYIKKNNYIHNRDAQRLFNLGPEQTGTILHRLVKMNLIQKVGNYQKTIYTLPD